MGVDWSKCWKVKIDGLSMMIHRRCVKGCSNFSVFLFVCKNERIVALCDYHDFDFDCIPCLVIMY